MVLLRLLILLSFCFSTSLLHASDDKMNTERTATLDFLLERAISRNLISGGVLVVGNHQGILYTTAHGRITSNPDAPDLNEHTLFDVASLTKVIATAPAVMKLLENGQLSLMDSITRWFPEFIGSGREDITILNLLTHTTGLDDIYIPLEDPMKIAIQKTSLQEKWKEPGNKFKYADINFILLGELVRRVSGKTLDAFCTEQLFLPLAMRDTMFLPMHERAGGIAPTSTGPNDYFRGVVQDGNARKLGGVAGHAGIFSSASDISRFARMMLGKGELEGKRLFSERVITQMIAPYFYSTGNIVRGLGWDIESPYSAPKGTFFSDMSFGHTGYSGSSIWIDPQRDLFVILMTTRLDYRDIKQFNRFRSDISTLAVAAFWSDVTVHIPNKTSISP